jgi:hypothetical protein
MTHMTEHSQTDLEAIEQAKLNTETALMPWHELQRFFAQGVVMHIAPHLDLLEVAGKMSVDDVHTVRAWFEAGELAHVTDALANRWFEHNTELWTVVVKPYILVQEPKNLKTH